MMRVLFTSIFAFIIVFTSACSQTDSSSKEGEYETTKKMVVDILKTDDGKKALAETLEDEKLKKELVIASDVVEDTINNTLISEKGADMWSTFFENPTFVENYAKSMSEEQKKLIKSLMNDSEYQKQMLELLQNPEITQQMLNVMKSQQFRSHLEETIEKTLDTPLFQAKMTEILLKAAEKEGQNKQENQDSSEGEKKESSEESEGSESGSGENDAENEKQK